MSNPNKFKKYIAAPAMAVASILGSTSCGPKQTRTAQPISTEQVLGEELTTWSDGSQSYEGVRYKDGVSYDTLFQQRTNDNGTTFSHFFTESVSCTAVDGKVRHAYSAFTTKDGELIDVYKGSVNEYTDHEGSCRDGKITAPEESEASTQRYFDDLISSMSD